MRNTAQRIVTGFMVTVLWVAAAYMTMSVATTLAWRFNRTAPVYTLAIMVVFFAVVGTVVDLFVPPKGEV